MYEQVIGPFRGYFVAMYVHPGPAASRGGAVAYYKVFAFRPDHYFTAGCLFKGCSLPGQRNPREALAEAKAEALRDIDNMPERDGFDACHERRPLFYWEAIRLEIGSPYRRRRLETAETEPAALDEMLLAA